MKQEIIKIPEVEKVLIEDFGIIKKADIRFSSRLNIISGKNASGKTTIMDYLVKLFRIDTMSIGDKILFDINNEINKNCILIDDLLYRLDKDKLKDILKNIEKSNRQFIVTLPSSQLAFVKGINANIIDTKNFELKMR